MFNQSEYGFTPGAHDFHSVGLYIPIKHDETQRKARAERAQFLDRTISARLHFRMALVTTIQTQATGPSVQDPCSRVEHRQCCVRHLF